MEKKALRLPKDIQSKPIVSYTPEEVIKTLAENKELIDRYKDSTLIVDMLKDAILCGRNVNSDEKWKMSMSICSLYEMLYDKDKNFEMIPFLKEKLKTLQERQNDVNEWLRQNTYKRTNYKAEQLVEVNEIAGQIKLILELSMKFHLNLEEE